MQSKEKVIPIIIDCSQTVPGVELKESRRGGIGLFTTRAFKAGDLIMREPGALYHADQQVIARTPLGDRTLSECHGTLLQIQHIEKLDDSLAAGLRRCFGLSEASPQRLYALLTENGEKSWYVTRQLEFINHSSQPNSLYVLESLELLEGSRLKTIEQLVALSDLGPGEELTVDYTSFEIDFDPPSNWIS